MTTKNLITIIQPMSDTGTTYWEIQASYDNHSMGVDLENPLVKQKTLCLNVRDSGRRTTIVDLSHEQAMELAEFFYKFYKNTVLEG